MAADGLGTTFCNVMPSLSPQSTHWRVRGTGATWRRVYHSPSLRIRVSTPPPVAKKEPPRKKGSSRFVCGEVVAASSFPELDGALSADGRRLAFGSAQSTDAMQIWVAGADGSEPQQMTRGERGRGSPSWSPDGTRLFLIPWMTRLTITSGSWMPMAPINDKSPLIPETRTCPRGPGTDDGFTFPGAKAANATSGGCQPAADPSSA